MKLGGERVVPTVTTCGGALRLYSCLTYVIAVNTSTAPATAAFSVQGLAGRKLRVFRDARVVAPLGDFVSDKLASLGVAVYVAPPAGW